MIVRLGLLVGASIAAYTVRQVNVRGPKSSKSSVKRKVNDQDAQEKENLDYTNISSNEKEQEEEKEEVKLISGEINPPIVDTFDIGEDEFEELLSGQMDFPVPDAEKVAKADRQRVYEEEMANNASELERLRTLVQELEEREVRLEGELLEYYGLKEQESDIMELQRQLKIKTVEIDMLKVNINSLQAERKKLQEEVELGASARKDLDLARKKIKELQRQIQLEANQTKGQLLLLKQQVSGLQSKEEEAYKRDSEVEKKSKAVKQLEADLAELKRKNIELQHEKRDLLIKLDAAEAKAAVLSDMTETEMVAKVREEVNDLKHSNEDLQKQVEGLQMNRFSEVEELVYLRWVNACLRHELRNYQTPAGKMSARELSKNLSPKSQEKAKQLLLEYAGSERGQGDTDLESNFSQPSSPGSEDFDNASIDSSTSKYSSLSRRPSIIQKLKRWGKSKDDSSALSSPARSFSGGSPRSRASMSQKQRGPLESLMLRNASDSVAITSFGKAEQDMDGSETPDLPRIKTRVPSNDSLNSVAASFQLMSKSVDGGIDEKYPVYKDRHKLALEREKQLKEKAELARAEKFGDKSGLKPEFKAISKSAALPPKLTQIKEKVQVPSNTGDQSGDSKMADSSVVSKMKLAEIEKRPPRVPRPPPKSSGSNASSGNVNVSTRGTGNDEKVHRAPEVVEFYQSLMKREAKRDTTSLISTTSTTADARSNMIGEIANKSTFLLAVKADVETQGDFVQSLASEVRAASFIDIEDLVAFVNWLDEELSFLVDERAVLKHFDWPEGKADALREAAFEYQDLAKLEKRVSSYEDDPTIPCDKALKKMYSLLEKVEQSVYALLRTRDMAISRYKEFGIPVNWLMDSGIVGKIKLSSVQLAKKYMKRVATELDTLSGPEKEPNREFILLQGIRFAFRVHQFAGGFDAESMKAFEDLRNRANTQPNEDSKLEI
uniref:Protein CHUP1, chloroplastic n=1 Tax=Chenopodium quinoa TaxID=63459 RepID=A0A803MWC6_CHEQI